MKNSKTKYIHIAIIIIGIIYVFLPAFHSNLWFDESYSVAIAKHNFIDIWKIGGNDVHPILYYWMLHILFLIFGNSILAYRIFSAIAVGVLSILGYTHIRKDFGERAGLIFSFLATFLPVIIVYSAEIRMYTWTMLFVTIMFIYAYRIFKGEGNIKNWTIFAIFSLSSAYMHYYGLITTGVINLAIFIHLIIDIIKTTKKDKNAKILNNDIKAFIISAITQIILYIPWLIFFIKQYTSVSKGFWIQKLSFIEAFKEIFAFQFTGNLSGTFYINNNIALIFAAIITLYIIYEICISIKRKEAIFPGIFALTVYLSVILIAGIVSIKTPVLYARYIFTISGIFIFFMTFFISKEKNKYINAMICLIIIIVSVYITIDIMKENYDDSNMKQIEIIQDNIDSDDIIIYGNNGGGFGSGFVVSAFFPNNMQYFYDEQKWNVEEAYKAYGPNMKIVYSLDEIKNIKGKIWIIGAGDDNMLEAIQEEVKDVIIKEKFYTKYRGYEYNISLIETK